jgi:pyridoxal phosphate enzyme (YggS family)
MTIAENVSQIEERIAAACARSGRNRNEIKIVAITKTVDLGRIQEAINSGIKIIGENRVQEAWQKYQQLGKSISWHLVGHLQTNKIKRALEFADVIESVDSMHLANEINRLAEESKRIIEVFVQVNTSAEASKFGVQPEQAIGFIRRLSELNSLRVTGLMTIGAFLPDNEKVRPCFAQLRELRTQINAAGIENVHLYHLSMGMSDDFEVAIEEGSTLIRIGRAIFGER